MAQSDGDSFSFRPNKLDLLVQKEKAPDDAMSGFSEVNFLGDSHCAEQNFGERQRVAETLHEFFASASRNKFLKCHN